MSVAELEKQLAAVERAYAIVPRNPYEATVRHEQSTQRLAEVQAKLADFSGAHVDSLRAKLRELSKLAEERREECQTRVAAANFEAEVDSDNNDLEEELERAAKLVQTAPAKKKKPKKGAIPKPKREKTLSDTTAAPTSSEKPDTHHEEETTKDTADNFVVLTEMQNVGSSAIPSEVFQAAGGGATCQRVPGSSQATVTFHRPVVYDGRECLCRVQIFRCVLLALCYGSPTDASAAPAASGATDVGGPPDEGNGSDEGGDEGDGVDGADQLETGDGGLSGELVAEYLAQQAEKEEQELGFDFPVSAPPTLLSRLPHFSAARFAVLLCHGGYFAGGVFEGSQCLVHKSFQRYVVRKKQGGKQSSSAKDVGSYNSVGSQIRAAQEVKWKEDVCSILLAWQPFLDGAAVILYAAPGPQNRAVLTDFSQQNAAATGGGKFIPSPVRLDDPRVCRVPITTHRPTFEEVCRIHSQVSTCSILFGTAPGLAADAS